ncbi:hypothetical protein KJ567_06150 [Candidatus Bipolaricaulota bacterium]|nr:hypothetical protein [Candidatus Bipolaricaulota bacterium]
MTSRTEKPTPHIGTLNEKPLHAALKQYIAEEGDRFEIRVDRFVVDILRGSQIIEIQTGGTSALRRKLAALLERYVVRLVIPLAARKDIVRVDAAGAVIGTRRSPRRLGVLDAFVELASLREILADPNFSIEVVLIHEHELRRPRAPRGRWQKGWEVGERRLVEVLDRISFDHPGDFLAAVPAALPEPFTTADLAGAIGRPRRTAQAIAYCLREIGAIIAVDRTRQGIRYQRNYGAST